MDSKVEEERLSFVSKDGMHEREDDNLVEYQNCAQAMIEEMSHQTISCNKGFLGKFIQ